MANTDQNLAEKPIEWLGDSLDTLKKFPTKVCKAMGFALQFAQNGEKAPSSKPLKGITTGAGVLEIIEDFDGDTYRAVYTVKFEGIIYVLHTFQKKSKSGIKTPPKDIEIIKQRFMLAEKEHKALMQKKAKK